MSTPIESYDSSWIANLLRLYTKPPRTQGGCTNVTFPVFSRVAAVGYWMIKPWWLWHVVCTMLLARCLFLYVWEFENCRNCQVLWWYERQAGLKSDIVYASITLTNGKFCQVRFCMKFNPMCDLASWMTAIGIQSEEILCRWGATWISQIGDFGYGTLYGYANACVHMFKRVLNLMKLAL